MKSLIMQFKKHAGPLRKINFNNCVRKDDTPNKGMVYWFADQWTISFFDIKSVEKLHLKKPIYKNKQINKEKGLKITEINCAKQTKMKIIYKNTRKDLKINYTSGIKIM